MLKHDTKSLVVCYCLLEDCNLSLIVCTKITSYLYVKTA
jgi:hypothetical protein